MSLRNGNEYFPKPSGAEVYACNVGKMKCGWVEVRNLTGTKWRRNGTHIPQAHGKQTRYIFISALLMGGGVLMWLSYIGDSLNTHRLGVINLPLCL